MSNLGMGTQFDRSELQRLMREQGIDADPIDRRKEKESKGNMAARVIGIIIAVAYFAFLIAGRLLLPEDNIFLRSLDVFSGSDKPNKILRIVGLIIMTLSVSAVLRLLMKIMAESSQLTKRTGKALIELLSNLIKYAAILVLVMLILNSFGVNAAALVAGLGVLSLIIGLGVTSLVEDIVAGIFIIGERLFDVGDIVVVDDFRGTIVSIGFRSTQIEDDGGDILILRNSSIESLVNMTNRASYAICDIPISKDESYEHVEEVVKSAELHKLMERYPEIEKGPFCLGLSEITESGTKVVTFVAVCQENTKYWIQRIMNRELALLFESHGIALGGEEE